MSLPLNSQCAPSRTQRMTALLIRASTCPLDADDEDELDDDEEEEREEDDTEA